MPRLTHRSVTWLVLLVAAGLTVAYAATIVTIGDGHAEYQISLSSSVPIRAAGIDAFGRPEDAELPVNQYKPDEFFHTVPDEGLRGELFEVRVPITTRTGGLGFVQSYSQHRYLAVVAIQADGRRVGKVVELPDARESREVTVRLD